MKLTNEELALILAAVDTLINPDYNDRDEILKKKLCKKISVELDKKGYTTVLSRKWVK